jgi:coenzyme F420-reducing hydrogenase delta subunit/ferredoxin
MVPPAAGLVEARPDTAVVPADAPPATWQPRITALICNWCTYAGADMAGTTRRAYPATVRAVRVPCTGRIDPLIILKAFEQGADGVVVSGCHPGDCHYVQGNYFARRRFAMFRSLVEFLGLDARRLHFAWVSASEGTKWSQLVEDVTTAVRDAGPIGDWARHAAPLPEIPEAPAAPRQPPPAAEQEAVAGHLRALAARLLDEKQVAAVIGYTPGPLPGRMVPAFATTADEAAALGWNERCCNDLVVYAPTARRKWGKVAIVVKRCDAGAVSGLLRESQIPPGDVTLIGVSCPGVWDDGPPRLALKCYDCKGEVPGVCDWTVTPDGAQPGAVASNAARAVAANPRDAQVAFLESLPANQRWAFWMDAFERCLRCYGCRAVCPLCYCQTCVADKNQPQWVPTSIAAEGNLIWNVTRAFHLVGRCGGCDECARVCPADIRLDLLNHKLWNEVKSRFGAAYFDDPTQPAPLVTFKPDDAQEFIR